MTDINFQTDDRIFQWDEEKNLINRRKHGIDFTDAVMIFEDENRLELLDEFHSDEEERWQVIGKIKEVLFVIYTERGDITRIISARKATARERRMYYGNSDLYFT